MVMIGHDPARVMRLHGATQRAIDDLVRVASQDPVAAGALAVVRSVPDVLERDWLPMIQRPSDAGVALPPVIVAIQALRGRRAPTWCVVIAILTVAGLAVVWCWAIVGGVLCVDAIAASVLPNRPDRADSEGQNDCSV